MAGPNGQPAMYEVRNGNDNDKTVYGTVDKPKFPMGRRMVPIFTLPPVCC